jgi:diguanylate cyclase (GGDEF)-like protein
LTFGVTGIIHLGAIFEFYIDFLKPSEQLRVPVSWMIGQTLLGLLLLVACVINKWLPWPRDPGKNVIAISSIVVSTTCIVAVLFLIFPSTPAIRPHSPTPRPWELFPAFIFLIAVVSLNSVKESDIFAFDTALVWVAKLNVASHLIASQSARLLDASAGVAELVNAISYIVLLGATLLDNARLFRQVRTLAISDSLTGLANYRYLIDILQGELERSGRTNRAFSLLLMDLDGLKKINDRHGHVIGSRALCRVATILRLNSRSIDTAARYGGDEFALVLPETNTLAAEQVVERVRNCLLADGELPQLSLSIGIATFPKCGVTVQQLLEYADRALYAMKEQSKRGRVEKRKRT